MKCLERSISQCILPFTFLFTTYADDSTFFLKDISSVKMLVETFKEFSCFSGLKPNIAKCEIAGLAPPERDPRGTLWFKNCRLNL